MVLAKVIAPQSACKKIILIYKLIQQILGSRELNGHTQFRQHLPKNH